jgi:hypothetical protein
MTMGDCFSSSLPVPDDQAENTAPELKPETLYLYHGEVVDQIIGQSFHSVLYLSLIELHNMISHAP